MEFRIGVNLGDVVVDGEQIYGDGINVAARLESLAEPGGICISGKVHEEIRNKLALKLRGPWRAAGQEYRRAGAGIPGAAGGRRGDDEEDPKSSEKIRTAGRFLDGRSGDYRRDNRARTACLAQAAAHLRLDSACAESGSSRCPTRPSIAVLPFTNMSGDHEQEYFSDGITDDLITDLSRLPGLFVIARTSTFTYKGKPAKLQEVGRELGVKYVLEGSVRKAAEQVRITVQLADATTGDELWAERYDRPLHDVFALQDEIVRRIVTTLNLQLVLSQQGILIPAPLRILRPMTICCVGGVLSAQAKDGNAKARPMFEKAIELDP